MKQVPLFDEPKRRTAAKRGISKRVRKLSQYYTPEPLAARIASFALRCCPNARTVLEPSAGRGAIASALLALQPQLQVTCVDLDVGNAQHLLSLPNVLVARADYLTFAPSQRFDLVVMNPPFEHGAVAEHVLHALEMSDNVVLPLSDHDALRPGSSLDALVALPAVRDRSVEHAAALHRRRRQD